MEQMKEILKRIQNGETGFSPVGGSQEALRDFQPLAKRIISANERGFLTRAAFSKNYEYGVYYIDDIVVGGLTFEGEKFLESQQNEVKQSVPASTDKQSELIKWEPKFLGFKLEGNELIRRLQRWFIRRKNH